MDFIYPVIIIIGLALFIHIGTRAFKKIKKERKLEHFGWGFDSIVARAIETFIRMIVKVVEWFFNKMMKIIFRLFTRFLVALKGMITYILVVTKANIRPLMKYSLITICSIIFFGTIGGASLYFYRWGQGSVEVEIPPVVVPTIGGYKQKYFKKNRN
jgi:hypothetical protein